MASGGRRECHFYNTNRGCWKGNDCGFLHIRSSQHLYEQEYCQQYVEQEERKPCRFFQTPGGCKFGETCRFDHVIHATCPSVFVVPHEKKQQNAGIKTEKYGMENTEKWRGAKRKEQVLPYYDRDEPLEPYYYETDADCPGSRYDGCCYRDDDDDDEEEEVVYDKLSTWDQWLAKFEDRYIPDVHETECGECGMIYEGRNAVEMLKDHYWTCLVESDPLHISLLSTDRRFTLATKCFVCDRAFGRASSLLQHVKDKSRHDGQVGEDHGLMLNRGIIDAFCYHDVISHDRTQLLEEIVSILVPEAADRKLFSHLSGTQGKGSHVSENDYNGRCYEEEEEEEEDDDYYDLLDDAYYDKIHNEMLSYGLKPWEPDDHETYFSMQEAMEIP